MCTQVVGRNPGEVGFMRHGEPLRVVRAGRTSVQGGG